MSYYATSLLWLKLTDVKAKQGQEAFTSEEKSPRIVTAKNAKLVIYVDDASLIVTSPSPTEFATQLGSSHRL